MELQYIFSILGAIISFFSTELLLRIFNRKHQHIAEHTICSIALISGIICIFFFNIATDSISELSLFQYLLPLISATVFMLIPTSKFKLFSRILIIYSITLCIIFLLKPLLFPQLPKSINYLIISAIWSFITLSLRCINIIAGQISLSVTIFGLGLFIFYFLGGLPFAIGFSALCTGASSLSFYLKNRISPTVKLSEQGADSLGFLIGGFVILTIPEQSFPATAILLFFPFCEIIFALIQSLPFFNHGNKLRENTACFKACSTGLNCEIIDRIYFKIMIMTLFFGCFQLYAPASYSLWPICLVIVIWQQYRIIHWSTLSSGINDTNQKFVSNLNKQITSLKENFKQTDKKR